MEGNRTDFHPNFQAISRAPVYPQSITALDPPLGSPNPSRPIKSRPGAQPVGKTEAVSVEFMYANPPNQANNIEASSDHKVPFHRNNQVGIKPTTVEPARQSSSGMAKTKTKSNSDKTLIFVSHKGRGQLTQEEVFASKDADRAVEVATKTEPGASAVAVQEKAKSGTETSGTETASPPKLAIGQATSGKKVESVRHGSTQEVKVKPNPEKTSGGPRNAPRKDQSREAKEKGEDVNDRASNYIRRAKLKIRTPSNAGAMKGAGQKDSGTDHFGNYIERAKLKIRMMTGIGGDRNVQSERP